LEQLLTDWPFFLQTEIVMKHCEKLLGLDVRETIASAYQNKAPLLLRYCKTKSELNMSMFLSMIREEKTNDNYQAILQGIILCVQKCLGEEEQSLMFPVDVSEQLDT
jgi:hypothetical protein